MADDRVERALAEIRRVLSHWAFDRPVLATMHEQVAHAVLAVADAEHAKRVAAFMALADSAWGVVANADGGDWKRESGEWQQAAARFRDAYHAMLAERVAARKPVTT